mgnify:CR=1 FL=1
MVILLESLILRVAVGGGGDGSAGGEFGVGDD